ncbi:AAA family ATPase [Nonomuraea sp. NPDC048881]|uniref:AAA family ATPase n=1 Tax=Nonomuraea sp. NPDC048881 TaxID=3155030 RepID=UPI0033CDD2EF
MFKLSRSFQRDSEHGASLPQVYKAFKDIHLYRGDVVMMAGPPGAGKSALATNLALSMRVPTLYVSCDMGPTTFLHRAAAIHTTTKLDEVRREPDRYLKDMEAVDHLYVTYPSRPDAEGIARAQMAFQEIHGLPSDIMVVDNLMNLTSGAKDEWTGLRELSQVMHYLATELQIVVLLLHHLNLGGLDLRYPAPLNAIKGQVTELPAVVLTLAKGDGVLYAAPVKNRHGKADPSGKTYVSLDYSEETQKISDPVPNPTPQPAPRKTGLEIPDWFSRAIKDD